MKTTFLLALTLIMSQLSWSQEKDSLGMIGDNLDLYAVLDAFKHAESIEEFERAINDPDQQINNLDLNEDDEVDYIQVHDEGEGDAHAIVLRIDMGSEEGETQDVAVVELEKTSNDEAVVQIVGDEDIYGEDYIIEPKGNDEITKRMFIPQLIIINVWGWPSVRFVFGPRYKRWRSPYRWGRYPKWWRPWRPIRRGVYRGLHARHRAHFHVVKVRRCNRAHAHFVKHRRHNKKIVHHHHYHGPGKKSALNNKKQHTPTKHNNTKKGKGKVNQAPKQNVKVKRGGDQVRKTRGTKKR